MAGTDGTDAGTAEKNEGNAAKKPAIKLLIKKRLRLPFRPARGGTDGGWGQSN